MLLDPFQLGMYYLWFGWLPKNRTKPIIQTLESESLNSVIPTNVLDSQWQTSRPLEQWSKHQVQPNIIPKKKNWN